MSVLDAPDPTQERPEWWAAETSLARGEYSLLLSSSDVSGGAVLDASPVFDTAAHRQHMFLICLCSMTLFSMAISRVRAVDAQTY